MPGDPDDATPANAGGKHARRDAQGRWLAGVSGNSAGRPEGSRNKSTIACDALMEGAATGLTERAIELAMAGDVLLLRAFMDRIAPVPRDRPVAFTLPAIADAASLPGAIAALLAATASGELTPTEAARVGSLVSAFVQVFDAVDLQRRVDALEAAAGVAQ